jgi:hypothetical protein
MRAKASRSPEAGFYDECPVLAGIGRAVVVVEMPRECGYPHRVIDVVAAPLARLQGERGLVARITVGLLAGIARPP